MEQRSFFKLYPHDYLMKYTALLLVPSFVSPNHITILRMLMTPFVVWILYVGNYEWGIPLFIFASFSDVLDGSLARIRQQITPWGIFFDPVADKLLIGCVVLTVAIKYFHPVLVFGAIFFDILPAIIVSFGGRLDDFKSGANIWGKTKMVLQFVSITFLLFGIYFDIVNLILAGEVTLGISIIFAIIAAITYSL